MNARGSTGLPFLRVKDSAGLEMVRLALDNTHRVCLDVETTGLDPQTDRIRLLSLGTETIDGGCFIYLVDCAAVDPSPLLDGLADKELIVHNGLFDLVFLSRQGLTPRNLIHDTMLMAQVLTAGTGHRVTLAACCERWLGRTLDKANKTSDWAGELTAEQLAYAAADVEVLEPLYEVLEQQVKENHLEAVATMEERCLPALVWMARQGVAFDRPTWSSQVQAAGEQAHQRKAELDALAPPRPEALMPEPWNWNSPEQAKQALRLAGCEVTDTTDSTLAALTHPLGQLLRRYRAASKRVSIYHASWLEHVAEDSRIYPSWRQCGAVTGRMSCSAPNLQQWPRGESRRCLVAPPGRVLVKVDWSQLHLRIIAKVAPEPAMQAAFQEGVDLHTATARRLTGKEEVSKDERQRAKAAAFGLCYGMGADRFRAYALSDYRLELTPVEAGSLRREFFRTYPGLKSWHRRQLEGAVVVTSSSGRACREVRKFSDKLAYSILLVEADCLKTALAMLWERRDQVPGAFPVLACHDELVIECDQAHADQAEAWLVGIMLGAAAPFLAPVPVEVSASVGTTWGGGEIRSGKTYRNDG